MEWSVLPGRSLNDTPYISNPTLWADPTVLDVIGGISFHWPIIRAVEIGRGAILHNFQMYPGLTS